MSPEIIGAIGLVVMILLVVLRVPVALAMLGIALVPVRLQRLVVRYKCLIEQDLLLCC
jgi:hypothetical protein